MKKTNRNTVLIAGALFMAALAVSCFFVSEKWNAYKATYTNDSGATIIMDDELTEADKKALEEQENMTVHVRAHPVLDGNEINIGFKNVKENALPQSFQLKQDGKLLYKSGSVEPGMEITNIEAKGAKLGKATVEIVSISNGVEYGNSAVINVEIVDPSWKSTK